MPTEMTIEAAIIELNRLKTTERMDIDRDRLTAAVRVVLAAAKYRIPQKPEKSKSCWAVLSEEVCPTCKYKVLHGQRFCAHCGQALDWS